MKKVLFATALTALACVANAAQNYPDRKAYGKGLFQYKAKRCYNISLEAIAHETATPKQEWSARQKWRDIFGTDFPD